VIRPLYFALVDAGRLREVVTNLYDNAVKYTPEGKVSMGLTGDAQVIQFYVRDTGPGIPPEDLPHLFQKFYRVDNSATRTIGGTGLGLRQCGPAGQHQRCSADEGLSPGIVHAYLLWMLKCQSRRPVIHPSTR